MHNDYFMFDGLFFIVSICSVEFFNSSLDLIVPPLRNFTSKTANKANRTIITTTRDVIDFFFYCGGICIDGVSSFNGETDDNLGTTFMDSSLTISTSTSSAETSSSSFEEFPPSTLSMGIR